VRALVLLVAVLALTDGSLSTSRGRSFKGGAQDFRALSSDGRLLLAAGTRSCKSASSPFCHVPVLTVYRTRDVKKAAELEGPRDDYFYGGAIAADGVVTAKMLHAGLRWNPASGETEWDTQPGAGIGRGLPSSGQHAIAPDGSIEATVRVDFGAARDGDPDDPTVHGPGAMVWLDVTAGSDRESVRRLPLNFPEHPTRASHLLPTGAYWTGARMRKQFAEAIAISPDRRWIAIGYGVRFGDYTGDAQARIAIFALADGHRAGWIDGARYRRNILWEALSGGDGGPTEGVPLGDRMAFSPDSQVLYGTSLMLFGVDVSGLR
jgi:hypothetical protein